MSKFDTHGGYFAPKDYMRVNEGGSHEENPNGGVQIGVDPEGNPNLLEEGEPVYKDYVYSDNIEAEEQFLVDNNLPKKYTGKLYSKIADDLFSEAEERPLDPISHNGLDVLLGRLADAQEGQKQAKEQKDLEDELASLSPEELDQLEAMLSQEEGAYGPTGYPGDPGVEIAPEEQMADSAEPMPVEGMPMMACGGKLRYDDGGFKFDPFLLKRYPGGPLSRAMWEYQHGDEPYPVTFTQRVKAAYDEQKLKSEREKNQKQRKYEDSKFYHKLNEFDDKYLDNMWLHPYYEREAPLFPIFKEFDMGGPLTEEQKRAIIEQGPILDGDGVRLPSLLEMALGSDNKIVQGVQKAQDWMENSTVGRVVDAVLPDSAMEAFTLLGKIGKAAKSAYTASDVAVQVGKWTDEVSNAQRALDAAETIFKTGKDTAGNAVARDVAKSGLEQARKQLKFAKRELSRWSGMAKSAPKAAEATGSVAEPATKISSESTETATKTFNGKKLIKGVIGGGVGATGLVHGYNYLYKPIAKDIYDHRNQQPYIFEVPDSTSVEAAIAPSDTIKIGSSVDLGFLDEEPEYKALGGKINRFDDDGKKVEGMDVMAVDENGNLIADIEPAIVTAERKMNPYYIPVHRSVSEPFFTDIESNSRRDSTEEKNSFEDKMSQLLLAKSFFSDNDDDKFMLPLLLHSYYNNSHRYDGFSEPSGQMDKMSPEELMRRYYLEKMWESVGEDGVNRYDFGYYAVPPEMVAGNPNYSEQAYATDNDAGSIIGAILAGKISPEDYAGRLATSDYRNSFFDYLAHNGIGYDQIASADKNTLAGWYYDYSRNALGDKEFGRRYRQGLVDDAEQLYDAYKQGGGSAPSYSDEYLDYVRNNNPLLYESYYAPRNNNQVASRMQSGVRANVANIDPSVFDVPITPFDASMISEYVPEDIDVDSVITNNYRLPSGSFSRDDLGTAANFAPLESFIDKVVSPYAQSRNPGGISGTYSIDRNFDLGKYKTIEDLENSDAYNAFTKYVMRNSGDPTVRAYLQALDNGTNHENNVPLLFDENGNLVDNWKDLYYERRYDQTPGIYHLNPEEIYMRGQYEPYDLLKEDMGPYRNANTYDWYRNRAYNLLGSINPGSALTARALEGPKDSIIGLKPGDTVTANLSAGSTANGPVSAGIKGRSAPGASSSTGPLPIWPRYAGAIGSGLLGLYNVFQQPDRYNIPNATPYLPEGRINLQNQVYNPIDQNMIANVQIAQGNATNRVLRNSGLGPSSAAAILAADNNLTGNLGTGFIQAWDANNQRRNAVLAANNQAEAQRAQFDYTVDAARKNILNTTQKQNLQNKLYQQMMNNQAEGDKYTAISNQISNGLQALSGIGQENFAMNQVNSNPTFIGYGTGPNGWMQYNPYYQFWLENKDKIKG